MSGLATCSQASTRIGDCHLHFCEGMLSKRYKTLASLTLLINLIERSRCNSVMITILDMVRQSPDDDDDDEDEIVEAKKKAAAGAELVLAFLWASEQGSLQCNCWTFRRTLTSTRSYGLSRPSWAGRRAPLRESVPKVTTTEEQNGRNSGRSRARALCKNSIECTRVAKRPGT